MECLVTLEQRLAKLNNGNYYTNTLFNSSYWREYLTVFEKIYILARVDENSLVDGGWELVNTGNISVIELPNISSILGLILNYLRARRVIEKSLVETKAVILKVPGIISTLVWMQLKKGEIYGVEVVGNAKEVFSKGVTEMRFRCLYKHIFHRIQLRQCRDSAASTYVTRSALQKIYPTKGFEIQNNDIRLEERDYIERSMLSEKLAITLARIAKEDEIYISNIGTMDQLYKGQDILIEAVKILDSEKIKVSLILVGEGRYRSYLETLSEKVGIRKKVRFTGFISDREEIIEILDASDIYVHPSRTEGLPRAVLEAMARGLPVIATDRGGMKEILPKDSVIYKLNKHILEEKIESFIRSPELLRENALANYEYSKEFEYNKMIGKRSQFLSFLKRQLEIEAGRRN